MAARRQESAALERWGTLFDESAAPEVRRLGDGVGRNRVGLASLRENLLLNAGFFDEGEQYTDDEGGRGRAAGAAEAWEGGRGHAAWDASPQPSLSLGRPGSPRLALLALEDAPRGSCLPEPPRCGGSLRGVLQEIALQEPSSKYSILSILIVYRLLLYILLYTVLSLYAILVIVYCILLLCIQYT